MSAATAGSRKVFTCPACGHDVTARLALAVVLGDKIEHASAVDATVTVTGLSVSHDCIPKATR